MSKTKKTIRIIPYSVAKLGGLEIVTPYKYIVNSTLPRSPRQISSNFKLFLNVYSLPPKIIPGYDTDCIVYFLVKLIIIVMFGITYV
jgi:hypothetical protein